MRAARYPGYSIRSLLYYPFLRADMLRIRKQIAKEFSLQERQRYAHGATAGLKEIVLYALIRHYKPKLMVETGVAQGVSTYFILKAMHDNRKGHLISIDKPNRDKNGYIDEGGKQDNVYTPKGLKPGWLVPAEFTNRWELKQGTSAYWLPKLHKRPDIFFHDSDHSYSNMRFELEWAHRHMKKNGVIIADDTSRNSAWSEFIKSHKVKSISSPISAAVMRD